MALTKTLTPDTLNPKSAWGVTWIRVEPGEHMSCDAVLLLRVWNTVARYVTAEQRGLSRESMQVLGSKAPFTVATAGGQAREDMQPMTGHSR